MLGLTTLELLTKNIPYVMAILHMENYVTINRQRIYKDKNFDDAVYVQ